MRYLKLCSFKGLLTALLLLGGIASLPAQQTATPSYIVWVMQESLAQLINTGSHLSFAGRYDYLKPAVESTHDMPAIAQSILGQHWNSLSPQDRAAFVQRFTDFTIASYVSQFDGKGTLSFEIKEESPLRGNRVLVRSILRQGESKELPFDCVLAGDTGQWRIVNVVVRGVSDLAVKRSEFSSILERKGFAALITRLNEKIRDYEREIKPQ